MGCTATSTPKRAVFNVDHHSWEFVAPIRVFLTLSLYSFSAAAYAYWAAFLRLKGCWSKKLTFLKKWHPVCRPMNFATKGKKEKEKKWPNTWQTNTSHRPTKTISKSNLCPIKRATELRGCWSKKSKFLKNWHPDCRLMSFAAKGKKGKRKEITKSKTNKLAHLQSSLNQSLSLILNFITQDGMRLTILLSNPSFIEETKSTCL